MKFIAIMLLNISNNVIIINVQQFRKKREWCDDGGHEIDDGQMIRRMDINIRKAEILFKIYSL